MLCCSYHKLLPGGCFGLWFACYFPLVPTCLVLLCLQVLILIVGGVFLHFFFRSLFSSVCHIPCGGGTTVCFFYFFLSSFSLSICLCFIYFLGFLSFLYFIECVCRACHIHGNCIVYSPYCLPLQWGSLYSAGYLVRAPAIVRVKSLGTT